MTKVAFIFPGQGSQYVGMGKDFFESFAVAKEVFQEADDFLGQHLSRLIFEGPENELTLTKNSQVAIFVTSMAILRTVEQLKPAVVAGLSLGEYTALCASKRLSFIETLKLVKERASLMNRACEMTSGTMAAVLGMNGDEVEEVLKGFPEAWPANFNCPGQVVISGTKEGVARASLLLKEKGARKVLPLNVHGAFHSPLMQSAQDGLKPFIKAADLKESDIALVMNVPGDFVTDLDEMKSHLIHQVTQSVRWEQGILSMKERGIEQFIEIGCGKTLAGLNKKMDAATISVDKVADLENVYATA